MNSVRVLLYTAIVALAALCTGAFHHFRSADQPVTKNHKSIPQEKLTHLMVFMGDGVSLCTATAIGPHALLTAEHCNDGLTPSTKVRIDTSTHIYNLLGVTADDRDHVIYLLDGPAFQNITSVVARSPRPGENVFMVGCGQHEYPCEVKRGKILDEYNPSDVDAAAGIFYFSCAVVPGDSGAAVYGEDGEIVGIVTYQIVPGEGAGFVLAFSQRQLDVAYQFGLLDILLGGLSNGNNPNHTPDAPTGLGATAY
jgi:hypothetical protein